MIKGTSYIFITNNNTFKAANVYHPHSFCGSGVQEWLAWPAMAQGPSKAAVEMLARAAVIRRPAGLEGLLPVHPGGCWPEVVRAAWVSPGYGSGLPRVSDGVALEEVQHFSWPLSEVTRPHFRLFLSAGRMSPRPAHIWEECQRQTRAKHDNNYNADSYSAQVLCAGNSTHVMANSYKYFLHRELCLFYG